MSSGTQQVDATFLEKVGDTLSSLSEGFVGLLSRVLGSSNEKYIRSLGYVRSRDKQPYAVVPGSILARVNDLEPQTQAMSDAELKELTPKPRARLAAGETLEDLLPEAFAAV